MTLLNFALAASWVAHQFENFVEAITKFVGGVYIARGQYSSFGEVAAVVSLGAVHMEERVQVIVQVEVGREEVGDRETHGERQNEDTTTDNQLLTMDGMKMV